MFRRLEPISPRVPGRHRSSTSAIPSVNEHDTSDLDIDRDDGEASFANKSLKTPSSTPDAAGLSVSVSHSKRKRKPKRRLTLGKDPSGKWKRRKLQLEEQQIRKALEDGSDDEDQKEMFDCIRVEGGFIMRGPNAGQQPFQHPPSQPSNNVPPPATETGAAATVATVIANKRATRRTTTPTIVEKESSTKPAKGRSRLRPPTFVAQSFLKESPGLEDESDDSSLSSLSELENELGIKIRAPECPNNVRRNGADYVGTNRASGVTIGTVGSEIGIEDGMKGERTIGSASSVELSFDRSSTPTEVTVSPPPIRVPVNYEPAMEIPETPQDTTMSQVSSEDEAAESPGSQAEIPRSLLNEQTGFEVRAEPAGGEKNGIPGVGNGRRILRTAEPSVVEAFQETHEKTSATTVPAGGENTSITPEAPQLMTPFGPAKARQKFPGDQHTVASFLMVTKFAVLKFPPDGNSFEIDGSRIRDPRTGQASWTLLESLLKDRLNMDLTTQRVLINWYFRIRRQDDLDRCIEQLSEHGRHSQKIVLCELVGGKHLSDDARLILRDLEDQNPDFWKGAEDSLSSGLARTSQKGGKGLEVDGVSLNDDLWGNDGSKDMHMSEADDPSAAHPSSTHSRLSATPKDDCNPWLTNQNTGVSLIARNSRNTAVRRRNDKPLVRVPERSFSSSESKSDGPSAKRRALEVKLTSTPTSRQAPGFLTQGQRVIPSSAWSGPGRIQNLAEYLLPSASQWRSSRPESDASTSASGAYHESNSASDDSDSVPEKELDEEPVKEPAPSKPSPELQMTTIQAPSNMTAKGLTPESTPEAHDALGSAEDPVLLETKPVTLVESTPPRDIPDSYASNSSQSSKMPIRNRGRPRKFTLASRYSIAPSEGFSVQQQTPQALPLGTNPIAAMSTGQRAWRAVPHSSTIRAEKSSPFSAWKLLSTLKPSPSANAVVTPTVQGTSQSATTIQPKKALEEAPVRPTAQEDWINGWKVVPTQPKKRQTPSTPRPGDNDAPSAVPSPDLNVIALRQATALGASGTPLPDPIDLNTASASPDSSEPPEVRRMLTAFTPRSGTIMVAATASNAFKGTTDKPETSASSKESSAERGFAEDPILAIEETDTDAHSGSPEIEAAKPVPARDAAASTPEGTPGPAADADSHGDQEVDDTRSEFSTSVDMEKINEGADILLWAAMGGSPDLILPHIQSHEPHDPPRPFQDEPSGRQLTKRRKVPPRKKKEPLKAKAKAKAKIKATSPRKSLTYVFKVPPRALKTIVEPTTSQPPQPRQPTPQPAPQPAAAPRPQKQPPIVPPPTSTASFTAVNIPRPQPYRRPNPTKDASASNAPNMLHAAKSSVASAFDPSFDSNPMPDRKPPAVLSFPAAIKPPAQPQSPAKPNQRPLKPPEQLLRGTPPGSIGDALANARKKNDEARRNTGRLDSLHSSRPNPFPYQRPAIPRPPYAKPIAAPATEKSGDDTSTDEELTNRRANRKPTIHPPSFKDVPRPPAYVPKPRPALPSDITERLATTGAPKMSPPTQPGSFYSEKTGPTQPKPPPALSTTPTSTTSKEWKLPTLERTSSPTLPLSLPPAVVSPPTAPLGPTAGSFGFPPASTSLVPLGPTARSFGFPPASTSLAPLPLPHLTPLPPPMPTEILFTVYRHGAPAIKVCIPGADIVVDGKLQWENLSRTINDNLQFDDYNEALIVNWCFLVEDQETLDKGAEMRAYVKGDNEVAMVAVDKSGSPKDPKVRERVKKGRRALREARGDGF